MTAKVNALSEELKSKIREFKTTLLSCEIKNQEMQDELRKTVKQIQSVRSTLATKQDVIDSTRATHSSCLAILADYHKLKSDLKSTQAAKESAEAQARDTEMKSKAQEKQLMLLTKTIVQLRAKVEQFEINKKVSHSLESLTVFEHHPPTIIGACVSGQSEQLLEGLNSSSETR